MLHYHRLNPSTDAMTGHNQIGLEFDQVEHIEHDYRPRDESAMRAPMDYTAHILMIEDSDSDAKLFKMMMQDQQYIKCIVDTKSRLIEGLQAMREKFYDVIMLDLSLPDSKGGDRLYALDMILKEFPRSNVIIRTGLSDLQFSRTAISRGAQDYILKGEIDYHRREELGRKIRYSVDRTRTSRMLEETQILASLGSWEYDARSGMVEVTQQICEILKVNKPSYTLTKDSLQATDHPLHIIYQLSDQAVYYDREKYRVTLTYRDTNASYVHLYVQVVLMWDKNGDLLRITGMIQDRTEQQKADEKVEASQKQIKRSQEQYEAIFKQTKDAICILNQAGRITNLNKATQELFGRSKSQLEGKMFCDLLQQEDLCKRLKSLLKSSKEVTAQELTITRTDGAQRHGILTVTRLENSYRQQELIVFIKDVTEARQAEALRKAREIADQEAKMKEQFLASVSHEMRTPMNAILGMSHLVLQTGLNDEQQEYIGAIRQSSENLLGIINDILEISTLQNGNIVFERHDFDIRKMLHNLRNVIGYKLKDSGVEFELHICDKIPQIMHGDHKRINQVLINLAGNAAKFTHEGKVRIQVTCEHITDSHIDLRFEVQDTGIGIPRDKLAVIFKPFTRIVGQDRLYEGTGLGLSIAQNIVEKMSGTITAESTLGKGSNFIVQLRLQRASAERSTDDASPEEATPTPDNLRILLVEDHKMNQLVARKTILKRWASASITLAENGKEATELLADHAYDLVLMDIQMPIMDGYDATRHIRTTMPQHADTPILAMTAHAHIAKDERFREYGFDDFVLKPFEPKQLFAKISRYTIATFNSSRGIG